jgi:phasin
MMSKQPFDFAVPPEMRALAEKSVEQARQAFHGFVSAAERATAEFEQSAKAARAGAQDVAQKAMTFAEQNVVSSFDLAQRLVAARDIEEVVKLHADYVRRQLDILTGQARELNQSATRAEAETASPRGSEQGGKSATPK